MDGMRALSRIEFGGWAGMRDVVSTVDAVRFPAYTRGKVTEALDEEAMDAIAIDSVPAGALWERVIMALRHAIVLGDLAPGSHLKEPDLAQRFGVSRLPIREAIAQLDREGLVRMEPRRGAFVLGITEQDVCDIYECRLMLELAAIRRTAARIDAEGVTGLEALVVEMEVAVAHGRPHLLVAGDTAFHRRLIMLSGNRALITAWEPVAPLIQTILSISEATMAGRDLAVALDGHRTIIRVLAAHDAAEAEHVLSEHLSSGAQIVCQIFRSLRRRP
jgi:GntR family transcriptional regulator of gluconate operon